MQVWSKVKAGYFASGIEMFWLDDTEPNVRTGGLEYACGLAEHCGALWPNRWIETFTEGLRREGVASPVILTRAGWAGVQVRLRFPYVYIHSSHMRIYRVKNRLNA